MASSLRVAPEKAFRHNPRDDGIPLGFGSNFHDDPICRSSLRKSHALAMHTNVKHNPHTQYDFVTEGALDRKAATMASTTNSASPFDAQSVVLRFLGYFRERVLESSEEGTRVRRVGVLYHPVDETILVREATQLNAGMSQGILLKRQLVPKPDGTHVVIGDLGIGREIDVFGKLITIVDMDEATRRYFRQQGVQVPDMADPWPEDDAYNANMQKKMQTKPRKEITNRDMDWRRAAEQTFSGGISKHSPDEVRTAQKFLQHRINEHLQFAAVWNDTQKRCGDVRWVVVKFYLENDTVEIVEKRPENCGREGGAKLVTRQRVPIPGTNLDNVQQDTFGLKLSSDYMSHEALYVGATVRVAGRDYFLYDADEFTRNWYAKQGTPLEPPQDVEALKRHGKTELPKQYPPPHNGFGSEVDSLQNWKHLMLKGVKVDQEKLRRENGKVMLYRAVFDGDIAVEDEGRQFMVLFHRATDEVEIVERQLRNSGIVGGKFLAKGKHMKKLENGRKVPFTTQDFYVGAVVEIAGRVFRLEEIDERSRRHEAGIVDEVSEERVKELIVLLKNLLNARYCRLNEGYRALAPEGVLTVKELIYFFDRCNYELTEDEAHLIVRHFDTDGKGVVDYNKFTKMMAIVGSRNMDEAANSTRAIKAVDMDKNHLMETTALGKSAALTVQQERLKKILRDKLSQRRATVQEVFRLMNGAAPNCQLERHEFQYSLREHLHLNITPQEMEMLVSALFPVDEPGKLITYKQFAEFVEA